MKIAKRGSDELQFVLELWAKVGGGKAGRDALLAFYSFRAEQWKHLRTKKPIGSAFATVRHRTIRSKGCLSNKTALAMTFKLAQAAEKSWRRLKG